VVSHILKHDMNGGEWSALRPSRFTVRNEPSYLSDNRGEC